MSNLWDGVSVSGVSATNNPILSLARTSGRKRTAKQEGWSNWDTWAVVDRFTNDPYLASMIAEGGDKRTDPQWLEAVWWSFDDFGTTGVHADNVNWQEIASGWSMKTARRKTAAWPDGITVKDISPPAVKGFTPFASVVFFHGDSIGEYRYHSFGEDGGYGPTLEASSYATGKTMSYPVGQSELPSDYVRPAMEWMIEQAAGGRTAARRKVAGDNDLTVSVVEQLLDLSPTRYCRYCDTRVEVDAWPEDSEMCSDCVLRKAGRRTAGAGDLLHPWETEYETRDGKWAAYVFPEGQPPMRGTAIGEIVYERADGGMYYWEVYHPKANGVAHSRDQAFRLVWDAAAEYASGTEGGSGQLPFNDPNPYYTVPEGGTYDPWDALGLNSTARRRTAYISSESPDPNWPTDEVEVEVISVGRSGSGGLVVDGRLLEDGRRAWVALDRPTHMMLQSLPDPVGAIITVPRWQVVKAFVLGDDNTQDKEWNSWLKSTSKMERGKMARRIATRKQAEVYSGPMVRVVNDADGIRVVVRSGATSNAEDFVVPYASESGSGNSPLYDIEQALLERGWRVDTKSWHADSRLGGGSEWWANVEQVLPGITGKRGRGKVARRRVAMPQDKLPGLEEYGPPTLDEMIERLPNSVSLVYVDYRDQLSEDQLVQLFNTGDYSAIDDFEMDQIWENTQSVLDEYFDSEELDSLTPAEREELEYAVQERNDSDPLGDLARNTPSIGMRYHTGLNLALTGLETDEETEEIFDQIASALGISRSSNQGALDDLVYNSTGYNCGLYVAWDEPAEGVIQMGHTPPSRLSWQSPTVLLLDTNNGSGMEATVSGSVSQPFDKSRIRFDFQGAPGGYSWADVISQNGTFGETRV